MADEQRTFSEIASHYREEILSGALEPGSTLPLPEEQCETWGVSLTTINRALQALTVEQYIRVTPRGAFVADDQQWTLTPRDRLTRIQQAGTFLAAGETSIVLAAELTRPPLYVAELFDLDEGALVVRREWVAGRGSTRTAYAVTWYPATYLAVAPELLDTAPGLNHTITNKVLDATKRTITHARDDMHARNANAREANHLGVPVGSTIMAGAHRWSDEDGVIEYGEWCLPKLFTIGYEYRPTP
ncbi:GntR family transcriptional regulator [Streptomyces buecherae]|uniref:GntR family transcriptional regulator n=1 Tax=Streptomyces buecherae TaxID=2763006 RepID=UPI001C2757D5|nr:GntR family transcriptional regulator [Streptomyces buecherae]